MESFSVKMVVAILSSPAPPYSSGTPPPISPSSPPLRTSSAIRPGLLFSRSFTSGKTSFSTNSSAVWPTSFWSSLKSAGVKTSCGAGDSNIKLPPFARVLVTTLVAMDTSGGKPERFSCILERQVDSTPRLPVTAIGHNVELLRVADSAHRMRRICLVSRILRNKLLGQARVVAPRGMHAFPHSDHSVGCCSRAHPGSGAVVRGTPRRPRDHRGGDYHRATSLRSFSLDQYGRSGTPLDFRCRGTAQG